MKNNNITLDLDTLKHYILTTCNALHMPVRKTLLIKILTDLFECNTYRTIEFAIITLMEEKQLIEHKYYIYTEEYSNTHSSLVPTAGQENKVKYLLTLKEQTKHDLFFDVYAPDRLTPTIFFKYVNMTFPSLLSDNPALKFMEVLDDTFFLSLTNDFYAEFNDYPTNRFLTTFFDNPDCRIIIRSIESHKKYINFNLVLLSGRRRSYKDAYAQLEDLKEQLPTYFKNKNVHFKTTLLSMYIGNKRRNKKQ